MNWKTLSARRKVTLEIFLEGVETEQEALDLFSQHKVREPPVEEIRSLMQRKLNEKKSKKESAKATVVVETSQKVEEPSQNLETDK